MELTLEQFRQFELFDACAQKHDLTATQTAVFHAWLTRVLAGPPDRPLFALFGGMREPNEVLPIFASAARDSDEISDVCFSLAEITKTDSGPFLVQDCVQTIADGQELRASAVSAALASVRAAPVEGVQEDPEVVRAIDRRTAAHDLVSAEFGPIDSMGQ